ncbi:MAG: MlaD family protein [Wenzhouxiangella sp.]|jgi:phospholipid/cholesterol/gamma-HCH transport system substrate-binding protein|nr:MlaD family protein [Wenzhouxiangella sp.]
METRAPYVLIGLFVVLGLAGLVLFGLWSAQFEDDSAWKRYRVVFEQAVSGLSIGSSVQYNGITMGSVTDLYLDPDDPRQVVAEIRVRENAPIREDTVARLSTSGLTGLAFIQLQGGSPESLLLHAGDDGDGHNRQPPIIQSEISEWQRLFSASEDIATTASQVLVRISDILSDENAERVANTLENIDSLTAALTQDGTLITETLNNARNGSAALVEMLDQANRTLSQFRSMLTEIDASLISDIPELSASIEQTLSQLASMTQRLDRVVADNEQAFADFGQEGLSQVGPALQELRVLLRDLSRIGGRFERNPAQFILSGEQLEEYQPQ